MLSLELKKEIKASPERIYKAWTNADDLARWHCPMGMKVTQAKTDGKVGGRFSVNMVGDDGEDNRAIGEYLELTPYSRIRFTWGWEVGGGNGDNTEVTITIAPIDDAKSLVTLRHEKFESPDGRNGHEEGWTGALENLRLHLEN